MSKTTPEKSFSHLSDEIVSHILDYCQEQEFDNSDEMVKELILPMLADIAAKTVDSLLGDTKGQQIEVQLNNDVMPKDDELSVDQIMTIAANDLTFNLGQTVNKKLTSYPEEGRHVFVIVASIASLLHEVLAQANASPAMKLKSLNLMSDLFMKLSVKDIMNHDSKTLH